jgi:spore maturation protein SpmA
MLNAIWILMIVGALICGALTGRLGEVSTASTEAAKTAVMLVVGLVGVMAFWLGLMRVLQRGGLLSRFARLLRPLTRRLFPDVPPEHPAMSMMIMNIVANMLGLGNAATPFGLKAMVELDKLNRHKGVASNSMVLFLAINTSNLALLPTGMIALRSSLGSEEPGSFILASIAATGLSTCVAILTAKLLQRLPVFRIREAEAAAPEGGAAEDEAEGDDAADDGLDVSEAQALFDAQPERPSAWVRLAGWLLAIGALAAIGYALFLQAGRPGPGGQDQGWAEALGTAITQWPLALLIAGFVLYGLIRGVKVFDAVVEGGREAFQFVVRFVPYFIVLMVGIGMLRASGAIELLVDGLQPATSLLGMPAETLPMALMRPLSGKGAFGMAAEIMQVHGPDSLIGQIVSTMQGSTETTFYVLALYFGVVGIRRTRHTVPACLIADLTGILAAVWACRLLI